MKRNLRGRLQQLAEKLDAEQPAEHIGQVVIEIIPAEETPSRTLRYRYDLCTLVIRCHAGVDPQRPPMNPKRPYKLILGPDPVEMV